MLALVKETGRQKGQTMNNLCSKQVDDFLAIWFAVVAYLTGLLPGNLGAYFVLLFGSFGRRPNASHFCGVTDKHPHHARNSGLVIDLCQFTDRLFM
jgi:hypothetical protein